MKIYLEQTKKKPYKPFRGIYQICMRNAAILVSLICNVRKNFKNRHLLLYIVIGRMIAKSGFILGKYTYLIKRRNRYFFYKLVNTMCFRARKWQMFGKRLFMILSWLFLVMKNRVLKYLNKVQAKVGNTLAKFILFSIVVKTKFDALRQWMLQAPKMLIQDGARLVLFCRNVLNAHIIPTCRKVKNFIGSTLTLFNNIKNIVSRVCLSVINSLCLTTLQYGKRLMFKVYFFFLSVLKWIVSLGVKSKNVMNKIYYSMFSFAKFFLNVFFMLPLKQTSQAVILVILKITTQVWFNIFTLFHNINRGVVVTKKRVKSIFYGIFNYIMYTLLTGIHHGYDLAFRLGLACRWILIKPIALMIFWLRSTMSHLISVGSTLKNIAINISHYLALIMRRSLIGSWYKLLMSFQVSIKRWSILIRSNLLRLKNTTSRLLLISGVKIHRFIVQPFAKVTTATRIFIREKIRTMLRGEKYRLIMPVAVVVSLGLVYTHPHPKEASYKVVKTNGPLVNPKLAFVNTTGNLGLKMSEVNSHPLLQVVAEKIHQKQSSSSVATVSKSGSLTGAAIKTKNDVPIYIMVYPRENTTFSSESPAMIKTISKKEGDYFQRGDILVEYDCRVQEADLRKMKAQLRSAENAYKSATKLKSYESISNFEFVKAKSEMEMANADVAKQSALVDKCVIKAPYNGSVAANYIHVGETAKIGDPVLKIVNMEDLELRMQVPSIWLNWLKVGTEFTATIHETNRMQIAKVIKINPEINSVSQTVNIIAAFVSHDPTLLPGMTGEANFSNSTNEVGE